jgi:hypothetical protein
MANGAGGSSGGGAASVDAVPAGRSGKKVTKNTIGNRDDPGWKHGISIDGGIQNITWKYCEKVIRGGGIYRLKHHLAGSQKDVKPCRAVPEDVQKEMFQLVYALQEALIKKNKKNAGEIDKRRKPMVQNIKYHQRIMLHSHRF